MATPVVTVASGGLPVVDVTATFPKMGLPVSEALAGRGIAVTKVASNGLPVTYVGIGANLFSQGDLSSATGWGQLGGAVISGGVVTFSNGPSSRIIYAGTGNFAAGTYTVGFDLLVTNPGETVGLTVGGQTFQIPASSTPARYSGSLTLPGGTGGVTLNALDGNGGCICDNITVVKTS